MRTVATILFILSAFSASAVEFRNTTWQMSADQVIASEQGSTPSETRASGQVQLVYKTYMDGIAGAITYTLEDDRLVSASYSFKNDRALHVFTRMSKDLQNRHGKPAFQTAKLAVWRLEKTEIALTHLPDNTCYAAYWEKGYFAQMNQLSRGP